MSSLKLSVAAGGFTGASWERRVIKKPPNVISLRWIPSHEFLGANRRKGTRLRINNVIKHTELVRDPPALEHELGSSDMDEKFTSELASSSVEERLPSSSETLISASRKEVNTMADPMIREPPKESVLGELIMLSLPAIAGQAIEPLSQLMGTAYVGRLGVLELAAAGVSLSIFNITSKVFNIPLLSVATSFVAEDISQNSSKDSTSDGRRMLPSVSTALALSLALGLFEAAAMVFGSGQLLNIMGVPAASPMRIPAEYFLRLRAIGAPAVVVSLAIQGIFRGFKDTRTPVLCLGLGNLAAVFFFPISMYIFRMGVTGAALSTVASQYIVTLLMMWHLNKKTTLQLPKLKNLQFGGYLKSGGFLMGRTVAVATTVTLSTSMVARLGALPVAAHQICLQVWLSAALLVEAQGAASQALIASSLTKGEYSRVKEITYAALQTGLFTGVSLAVLLGMFFPTLSKLFTTDAQVLNIIRSLVLFVSVSQPLSAVAYIFDGLHYGVSDFPYAGCSMMIVGAMSCTFLVHASSLYGLAGVWTGLTLFMGLRTVTGFLRLSHRNGPWWFLQEKSETEVSILAGRN